MAPAVVGPDGVLGAEGWLPDHVRLGVLEEHLGPGTIEQITAEREQSPREQEHALRSRSGRMGRRLAGLASDGCG